MNVHLAVCCSAAALLTAIATPRSALAQQASPPRDSVSTLGAVVVSASRTSTTLEQMPLHTTLLSPSVLSAAPEKTLDLVLRNVPGLNMPGAPYYTTDPTGHQTRIRGVTNSTVLVLVDGIPVHDPFYSTTQWYKVPMSAVQRVEIVRGGNSSLWGNLAVSGVVNIVTKKPFDNGGQLDLSYQSLNTAKVSASKNFMFNNGLSFRASGDLFSTDGYQTVPDQFRAAVPGRSASSAKTGDVQLASYFTPSPQFTAFLRGGYYRENEDIGGYQFGTNLQHSTSAAAGITRSFGFGSKFEARLWTQQVNFDKSNGAACYLVSSTSCTSSDTTSPLVQYANSHDVNPSHELGMSAVLSLNALASRDITLQTGVDFRVLGGRDDAITYDKPTTTDGANAPIDHTAIGRGTQRFVGVFAQFTTHPVSRLQTTLALRYDDWANVNGLASLTTYSSGTPNPAQGGAIANSHRGSFNPSLSARLALTDEFSLRGGAYRAFRAPGLNNLYRSYSSSTSITVANPELSPQTLTGGELGADFRRSTVTLGATVFRYDTKNLIASYKITSPATAPAAVTAICGATLANCPANVNFNTNGQDALAQGLEFAFGWTPSAPVSLNASYTFTDSHYTAVTTSDPVGVQLGAIPKNVGMLSSDWTVTRHWNLHVGARYSGAMYLDVNRTLPQRAFTTLDASTSYSIGGGWEWYGSVVNATNVRYTDTATTSGSSETLGMPQTFLSGIRWTF